MLVNLLHMLCVCARAREREECVKSREKERERVSERDIYVREGGRARWRKGGRERGRV
jgi:hypothetical protein